MSSKETDIVDLTKLTTAGLQQIGGIQGDTKRKVLFWATVFLLGVVLLCYQIQYLARNLQSYPKAVDVQVTGGPIIFPTVTFCSLGMLKWSVVRKVPVFKALQEAFGGSHSSKRKKRQSLVLLSNVDTENGESSIPTTIPTNVTDCEKLKPKREVDQQKRLESILRLQPLETTNTTEISQTQLVQSVDEEAPFSSAAAPNMTSASSGANIELDLVQKASSQFEPELAEASVTKESTNTRSKRSVAGSNCSDPPSQCDFAIPSIFVSGMSMLLWVTSRWECFGICIAHYAVSYKFNGNRGYCSCYNDDCCNHPQRQYQTVTAVDYFIGKIGYCDDVFLKRYGTVTRVGPYYETVAVDYNCTGTALTAMLQVSATYTCQTSGFWSPSYLPCLPTCTNQFPTGIGSISPPGPFVPGIYTYTCPSGYLTSAKLPSAPYTCSGGSWDKLFSPCIQICIDHFDYAYGTVNPSPPFVSGSTYIFTCKSNWLTASVLPSLSYYCSSGNWLQQFAPCHANCTPLDAKSFSDRLSLNYSRSNPLIHGTVATFSCNDSYHMYGDFHKTNCVDGSWDVDAVDFPICLEQQVANYSTETLKRFADMNSTAKDTLASGGTMNDLIPFILSNLSTSTKSSLGFTKDDNLLSCTYGGRNCDKNNDILGWIDNQMGNCYFFNHKYMNESIKAITVGEGEGLYLIIDSKQEEFMALLPTAGMKLIIHQSFDPIFPDTMGIHVSPGFNYILMVQRQREIRVETPNSACYQSPARVKHYFVENVTYGIEACQRSKYQRGAIDKCGCASPNLPSSNCGTTLCQLENRTCVIDSLISSSQSADQMVQICPATCEDTVDRLVITMTENSINSQLFDERKYSKHYQKANIISVKVYFVSLDVVSFRERISYTTMDLFNDIASSIGSIVGMSAISLVELIVLLSKLIECPIKKLTH